MPEPEQIIRRLCIPQLGGIAPDFAGLSTDGPIQLSDYRGKWVVFFCHPGDFTPVCTTEFIAFQESIELFERRNTQLLGLSVGTIFSHIAWFNSIYESTGLRISFPLIADVDLSISRLYGLIVPETSETTTVRAVYIIDPNGYLRLVLYYPRTTGRNTMEILRCVDALQFTDKYKLATPANWVPGMPGVVPPPITYSGALNRERDCVGCECIDWYLCFYNPVTDDIEQIEEEVENGVGIEYGPGAGIEYGRDEVRRERPDEETEGRDLPT